MRAAVELPGLARVISGLLCATALVGAAAAEDWPQWQGPNRNNTSPETGLALRFGPEGPPVLWRRDVGGGFSSVASVGERLYTLWAEAGREWVVALEAASGAEIWRSDIGAVYENERGNGPRSTPSIDGDRLFVLSGRGRLVALALGDGRELWARDLVGELGAALPIWGFAGSPLVVDGMVVSGAGSGAEGGAAVAAFHRDDGRTVWAAGSDAPSYSSPIVADLAGRRQIVHLAGQSIVAVGLDGSELWTHPWPVVNSINIATPLALPDHRIFVSTSYDVGATVLEVGTAGDDFEVREVWRGGGMKNHFQSSVHREGKLYGFDNATLKCVDAATGEDCWRKRGLGKGQLLLVDRHLVVLGERGKLVVAEASPEAYLEVAAAELLQQRCWTPPTLADGRLYVRTESELLSLDLRGDGGDA